MKTNASLVDDNVVVECSSVHPSPSSSPTSSPLGVTTTNTNTASPETAEELPLCYPRWRGKPVYHGNPEVLGWALDTVGRAVYLIGMGAFLGTAILQLAKEEAGCDLDQPTCDKTVYGLRPSSLLTTSTMVVGLISAVLLPLMGAICDYTPHRRVIGRCMSAIYSLLIIPQFFISSDTWFAIAILLVVEAFIGWVQTMVTYAYLPELTDSEERLTGYTQSFTILGFGSMVIYLATIVGVSTAAGFTDSNDTIATARLALVGAFVVSYVALYIAWFCLLKRRPPARELPPDQSLWTAGFVQVYHSGIRIYKEFPSLKWFYVSISFTDAGINALATIALTYLTDTLNFGAQENGITTLLMLIGSIPGALLTGPTIAKFNPIGSSMIGTLVLMLNTIVAAIVLKEPGQQLEAYIFAFVWGIGTGWKWTTDRLMASTLIPDGQDAELMGFFLFSGQILTWLPPLIFTVLNEAGVNQRISIGTQAIFFFLGILALCCMGNYRAAVEMAGRMHVTAANDSSSGNGEEMASENHSGDKGCNGEVTESSLNGSRTNSEGRSSMRCRKEQALTTSTSTEVTNDAL